MNILKALLSFATLYWSDILVFAVFIAVMVIAWFKYGKKEWVKQVMFKLVVEAEKKFDEGTGLVKKNYVLDEFYNRMPMILKIFITRKMIDFYIEAAVDEMKEYLLSDGNNL